MLQRGNADVGRTLQRPVFPHQHGHWTLERPDRRSHAGAWERIRRPSTATIRSAAVGICQRLCGAAVGVLETHFPKERQVMLTDFEKESYFQRMAGWNERQYTQILDMLESCGAITLDN
ncbi:MAG: hypothetical protein GY801_42830 [bacterium]|nr:hypothetical protein [bacterium]